MRFLPTSLVVALLAATVGATVALRREPAPTAPPPLGPPPLLSATPQQSVPLFRQGVIFELKGFSEDFDKEQGIRWNRPRRELPSVADDIYLYFGSGKKGFTEPMLLIQRINPKGGVALKIVVEANVRTVTLLRNCMHVQVVQRHDHTPAGALRETTTFGIVAREDVSAIRAMARAERATLRFIGQTATEEREVRAEDLESMRHVIATYEELTGKPWYGVQMPERDCE